jgi:hypothetical protein
MISLPRILARRLKLSERGAAALEFALISPVFLGMLYGFFDFTKWSYVRAATSGALEQVARSAGVGGPAVNPRVFELQVENLVKQVSGTATFLWDKKSYYQFSGIGQPEKLTSDKNSNGRYDAGDCFEDSVPNGVYDTSQGASGVGGADDIVYYKVTVTYPALIDINSIFPSIPNTRTIVASTMVKRQPYAAQAVPSIRCV